MVYSFSFVILLCLEYGRCNLQKRLILDSIDSQQLFLDIQSLKASVADLQGKLSEQERTIRKLSISSGTSKYVFLQKREHDFMYKNTKFRLSLFNSVLKF